MNQKLIKPQLLKGFRDYLPEQMMARERLVETARHVYRSYGFSPIDTPALEYSEILLGKGGEESDKQLFRFLDQGNRDVAMRFDLTVPFARFAAQHLGELVLPFKRYHIGSVWRAEKPQKGRFREFMQCDFDTIGTDSNAADVETLLVIHDLMEALGFERFEVRVNNRLVLNGLLEQLDLTDRRAAVLRALDKLTKIGPEKVVQEMSQTADIPDAVARQLLSDLQVLKGDGEITRARGAVEASLSSLDSKIGRTESGAAGIQKLRELFAACQTAGIPGQRVALDVSIARGLDYYTGTIYETFLTDLPAIGSVCSGGRYDNLAGLFTSQPLPGVGASLGLDRLLAAMLELGTVHNTVTPASVLVTLFDAARLGDYLRIGRRLRAAGIAATVFPEARALGKQLKYANRLGFRVALIAGDEEFDKQVWQVKDLSRGEQRSVPEAELAERIGEILGPSE